MAICWDGSNLNDILNSCTLVELKNSVYTNLLEIADCCYGLATTAGLDVVNVPADATTATAEAFPTGCATATCPIIFLQTPEGVLYWSDDCGTTYSTFGASSTSTAPLVMTFENEGLNADQLITIPTGYTTMQVYAWGAGGSGAEGAGGGSGGAGGFSSGHVVVTAGDQYTVVVGQGGENVNGAGAYGFGGVASVAGGNIGGGGGGLSGVFTGIAAVLNTDIARGLVIAGGGGGANKNGTNENGFNGGSLSSGGQPTMLGELSGSLNNGSGGGGATGGSVGVRNASEATGGASGTFGIVTNPDVQGTQDLFVVDNGGGGFISPVGSYNHPYAPKFAGSGINSAAVGKDGYVTIILY